MSMSSAMVRIFLTLMLAGCVPRIPLRSVEPRAAVPEGLPLLAPCALVHHEQSMDLSDGAQGWFRGPWTLQYTSFLIRHPRGVLLVDAAFGDTAAADIASGPWLFRRLLARGAEAARPIATLLREVQVNPEEVSTVLVTHAHWDHTGGLAQLPRARVVMARAEADWITAAQGDFVEGAMPRHFRGIGERIHRIDFDGPPYDGFERSQDLYGDGSIIGVPSVGHTRGSTSWFINSGDGRRWVFAGDTAWVREGVREPVMKGRLASLASDHDRRATAESLGRIHALARQGVATVVTSHDERTWEGIPRCAAP